MSLFTFEVCDVKHEGRRKKKIQSSSKVHNLDSKGLPEKENENSLVKVNQNTLQQKWKCMRKKSFQPTNAYMNIFQNTTWSRAISTLKWHGKVLKKHACLLLSCFPPHKTAETLPHKFQIGWGGEQKIFIIADESVRVLNNMWPNKLLQLPTLAVARSYFYEPYMYFTNLHCEKNEKIVFIFPTKHFRFLLVWASVQIQLLKWFF